jgi:DNA polymerase I-like protein with 3'-5' exonuclease and polymerase domains
MAANTKATKPEWSPPPDPDFGALAAEGYAAWQRDLPTVISFDTETTGLSFHDTPFCVTVAWRGDHLLAEDDVAGFYFETDREVKTPEGDPIDTRAILTEIFDHAKVLVAHNIKFDMHRMDWLGCVGDWRQFDMHDTEGMAHHIDEHQDKGLKDLAVAHLGWDDTMLVPATRKCKFCNGEKGNLECGICHGKGREEYEKPVPRSQWEIDKAREWAKKEHGLDSVKDVGYHLLPRGTVVPYAILDAEWTYRLAMMFQPIIAKYPDTLGQLYARELRLATGALYETERAGMGTDVAYVAKKIKEYRRRCIEHEQQIQLLVGKPVRRGKIPPKERADWFNPSASSPDVGDFLTAHGFPRDSYDAENLGGIQHPLAVRILEYRKDTKILESYFISLQKETGEDGIFHPSIRPFGTVTGRTSAGSERGDQW